MHLKPWSQGERSLFRCLAVELSCSQWASFLSKLTSFLLCSLSPQALLDSSCSMWLETGMIKKGAPDYNKTKKPEFVLFSLKEDPVVGHSLENYNLENLSVSSGQRKACDNGFRDHDHSLGQWEDTQLTDPDSLFCLSPEMINSPQWWLSNKHQRHFKLFYLFFFSLLLAQVKLYDRSLCTGACGVSHNLKDHPKQPTCWTGTYPRTGQQKVLYLTLSLEPECL